MASEPEIYLHGSAALLGEAGVLIRGASGSGKSSLALALIEAWRRKGAFARLIGDDQLALRIFSGRALLSPHPAIAGLAEWRGLGLIAQDFEDSGVLTLIVDLDADFVAGGRHRIPDSSEFICDFNGLHDIPRLRLPARATERSVSTIMAFLHKISTK